MTQSASQAQAFYREVARTGRLWTLKDDRGFPAPPSADGTRAQPFWSSRSRVENIISITLAYADFEPVEVGWKAFCDRWVPGMASDGTRVGVNWSGPQVRGYDVEPERVIENVEAVIARRGDADPEG